MDQSAKENANRRSTEFHQWTQDTLDYLSRHHLIDSTHNIVSKDSFSLDLMSTYEGIKSVHDSVQNRDIAGVFDLLEANNIEAPAKFDLSFRVIKAFWPSNIEGFQYDHSNTVGNLVMRTSDSIVRYRLEKGNIVERDVKRL